MYCQGHFLTSHHYELARIDLLPDLFASLRHERAVVVANPGERVLNEPTILTCTLFQLFGYKDISYHQQLRSNSHMVLL